MNAQRELPRRRRSRSAAPATKPHLETYVNSQTGDLINVACVCAIGESHSYADWQQASAYRLAGRRPSRERELTDVA